MGKWRILPLSWETNLKRYAKEEVLFTKKAENYCGDIVEAVLGVLEEEDNDSKAMRQKICERYPSSVQLKQFRDAKQYIGKFLKNVRDEQNCCGVSYKVIIERYRKGVQISFGESDFPTREDDVIPTTPIDSDEDNTWEAASERLAAALDTQHTLPATPLRIAAATPPNQVDDGNASATPPNQVDDGNAYVFNHISPTNAIGIIY